MSDLKPFTSGYMKPPAERQFKKGTSGNPKGRPKAVETPYTALQKVLDRKVSLAGSGRKMPIREALLMRLRELAHGGDRRAVALQQSILAMAPPKPIETPFVDVMDAKERFMKIALANSARAEELDDDGEE
jgi:hypothetical protein